jgi:hypothetical protein
MGRTRLDSESPEVAKHLRGATPQEIRTFIWQACDRAVTASGLEDPLALQALSAMRTTALDVELASSLESLAERIDQEYFDAQERSDSSWVTLFQRARAAAALSLGVLVTDADLAAECVYEAAHALDDPPAAYAAMLSL